MPQADPIVRANKLRLVDDDYASEKAERVADYVQENWNDDPDITLTKIAEETDTSRQHVKNVIKRNFENADEQNMGNNQSGTAIPDREGVDTDLLRRVLTAYRIGRRDEASDDVDPGISNELLELALRE